MQFLAILFSTVAMAAPAPGSIFGSAIVHRQTYTACSGLYSTAQCCATDVLGVADLDCADPPSTPTNATNFESICSAEGQQAKCCVLPILDLDVLCETPSGVTD